ncbi:AbrB/MazE/SpoVT family DNA-binding domain-containing protein [Thioalkalivibrio sulfidiphilus]|uniref:AbrB family transcriptional regulator n=1 Tax=Thioalkalivibrio sulfidiphilus (strain HL-EbGR7) TaxID=396588 RepID=B8GQR7_THISH|nr:AbrB/MazE/SpoVT family DNA-binding domain-containing protein [Thioalkalivibrio sulfidiphilus]ACL74291.1 AbrB family transcriptional regulator [Thioalkalivibrio sulfidiphilus HL-EbGr7]
MSHRLTSKGQVTIPKKVRESLGLGPGSQIDFDVDEQGQIIIRKVQGRGRRKALVRDRFEQARGRATVKWRTDELMELLRGEA